MPQVAVTTEHWHLLSNEAIRNSLPISVSLESEDTNTFIWTPKRILLEAGVISRVPV